MGFFVLSLYRISKTCLLESMLAVILYIFLPELYIKAVIQIAFCFNLIVRWF